MLSVPTLAAAQQNPNVIITAVPILTLSPDARSAALGEAGVALSPDANAAYYNAGKLGFVPNKYSFSPSYTPWLRSVSASKGLAYFSGYARLGPRSVLAASVLHFDLGNTPQPIMIEAESAFSVSYGRTLSDNLGMGATVRYIHSNRGGNGQSGNVAAVDLGVYYTKSVLVGTRKYDLGLGASLSNVGPKMEYINPAQSNFLPTNLKIGTALTRELTPSNKLTLVVDANKLVVPTPYYVNGVPSNTPAVVGQNQVIANQGVASSIARSFSDAPGGFREELREINLSTGLEYSHKDMVFARAGYFYENPKKGDRQYVSLGAGARYRALGIDGAYLLPNSRQNPLAQTIRLSLHVNLNKQEKASDAGRTSRT